jgi:hypothetical protein
MESFESKFEQRRSSRLLFFQKPVAGNSTNNPKTFVPVQVLSPTGGFGIGMPTQQRRASNQPSVYFDGDTVAISGPEDLDEDNYVRRALAALFIALAICNVIATCVLFFKAHSIDLSKVMNESNSPHNLAFVQIPKHRRYSENLIFALTIINLMIGIFGAAFQNPLGLSAYCFFALIMIFIGFPVIPYFLYSFRYVIDAVCIYIALTLRSKLMMTLLPFYFMRR